MKLALNLLWVTGRRALPPALVLFGLAACATNGPFFPAGAGRAPAVIVLPSADGLTDHERNFARLLADAGYISVAVDPSTGGAATIEKGYDALRAIRRVDSSRIGIVGFSEGAFQAIAFTRDAHQSPDRRVKAIVSFYVGPNMPEVPERSPPAVLFLHGDQDVHVAPERLYDFCRLASAAGARCEAHVYRGIRHEFDKADTEYQGYDETTARDSWLRAVAFLNRYLKQAR